MPHPTTPPPPSLFSPQFSLRPTICPGYAPRGRIIPTIKILPPSPFPTVASPPPFPSQSSNPGIPPKEDVQAIHTEIYFSFTTECFSWSTTTPSSVNLGSSTDLTWTFDLSPEEQQRAKVFSLIIWEREEYLFSDQWLVLAIKQPMTQLSRVVGGAVTVLGDEPASLRLSNVTITDLTRFRCTFFSSFSAPRSVMQLSMPGERCLYYNIGFTWEIFNAFRVI